METVFLFSKIWVVLALKKYLEGKKKKVKENDFLMFNYIMKIFKENQI